MLKFVKHNMESISGIEIYPILSLLIFFLFFVGLYTWVYTYRKEKISEMSQLPFSEEEGSNNQPFNS
ncbi:CcoQ/FixQ family Cbb3-type cytochrome c oxidase assembly chaperone [Flavobacterium coralii]|uniref:CcoQ/FixQ family Cbb3-type cytochrome c oxidase assembly chaperone n=1 Tax=Flavobacterium coralii TaxID=2838017 RepID=UPI000C4A35B1|nr:CcoQ/FixQ family Cbb3-type cytochrome c oxidase assembly chaperone [Flavobacterium sp.]|tara:strand:+ start:483 stop:683 length:201 start_codon:yes stop_codon:yes gene_type:complete